VPWILEFARVGEDEDIMKVAIMKDVEGMLRRNLNMGGTPLKISIIGQNQNILMIYP